MSSIPIDERGRRSWQQAPDVAGTIAALIIKHRPAMNLIARGLGIAGSSLSDFVHGCDASGNKSTAILGFLKREGVEPIVGKYFAGHAAVIQGASPVASYTVTVGHFADAPWPGARAVTKWIDDTGVEHKSVEAAAMASKRAKVMQAARALAETHTEHKDFVRAIMEHGDLVIALAEAIRDERALDAVLTGKAAVAA